MHVPIDCQQEMSSLHELGLAPTSAAAQLRAAVSLEGLPQPEVGKRSARMHTHTYSQRMLSDMREADIRAWRRCCLPCVRNALAHALISLVASRV